MAYLDERDEVPRPAAVRNRLTLLFLTAVLVYAIDVVTKLLAVAQLEGERPIDILGEVFELRFTRNPGAAFSLGVGMTIVFSCITIGVILAILRTAKRLGSTAWALVFGLVLGGALGNLTDRIFRDPGFLRGHVIDFLHITHWPIFNVADMAFTAAGVIVVFLVLRNIPLEGRQEAIQQ